MLQFRKGVADVLLFAGKEPIRKTQGRPKKWTSLPSHTSGKKLMVQKPAVNIRYDRIHRWPKFGDRLNRRRLCSMLSFVYCYKC